MNVLVNKTVYESFPLRVFLSKLSRRKDVVVKYVDLETASTEQYLSDIEWSDYVFVHKPYDMNFIPRSCRNSDARRIVDLALSTNKFCYIPYGARVCDFSSCECQDYKRNMSRFKFVFSNYYSQSDNTDNCVVVGNLLSEMYSNDHRNEFFSDASRRHVIYAPHFTLDRNFTGLHTNYMRYYDDFFKLFKRYKNDVEFILKPHPELGRVHRISYSDFENNGIKVVEDYDYIQLFNESDGMIHDSSAFVVEYQHVNKPAMFMFNTDNFNLLTSRLTDIGFEAMKTHYMSYQFQDVQRFIEDVIVHGNDTKKKIREQFYSKWLKNSGNKLPSDKIISILFDNVQNR